MAGALVDIFYYPGVTCCQDGDGRLCSLWASKTLFRNLRLMSWILHPYFLQSMVGTQLFSMAK